MAITSPGWSPSLARTVAPAVPTTAVARAIRTATIPLAWNAKAPEEVLDYSLSLTDWLADGSDVIRSAHATAYPSTAPTDLAVLWTAPMSGGITTLLAGGLPGQSYVVSFHVLFGSGRTALFDVSLPITTDAAVTSVPLPSLPPIAMHDASGAPLLLGAGVPLLLA